MSWSAYPPGAGDLPSSAVADAAEESASTLTADEARRFVGAVAQLAQMADRALPRRRNVIGEQIRRHLGLGEATSDEPTELPNTGFTLPVVERVNLQRALDAWRDQAATWTEIGLPRNVGNYDAISLAGFVDAGSTLHWHGPARVGRQYDALPVGVDATLDCLVAGVVLTEHDDHPVAVLWFATEHQYPPIVRVEVAATDQAIADEARGRLQRLIDEHDAFRGQVLAFSFGEHGEFGVSFATLPTVGRDDLVLPERDLAAVERHAIGISEHAAPLREAGHHVKRGLLLYGPPGTGKTHTIAYLTGRMPGRTTIVLSGAAVGAVGQAGAMARRLQPATIVIEDVDLIAMDRQLPGGEHNALLFQLLNEMDGLSGDADVLFVLTTNRVEMLEEALTARPGRVDQAVELGRPDPVARRQLLALYAGPVDDGAELDRLIERLDGVAAAFIKELGRRGALVRWRTAGDDQVDALHAALDEMTAESTPILRATLGAGDGDGGA